MKMPSVCPICNSNMINEFIVGKDRKESLRKLCSLRLSHQLIFTSVNNDYDLVDSLIFINVEFLVNFISGNSILIKNYVHKKTIVIPYFEPDFSNIKKMLNKIKLYSTFS